MHQIDAKTAYLNVPIDCDIPVDQPEGFEVKFPTGEKVICELNKSLYGLKQSGRSWNSLSHTFFVENVLFSHLLIHVFIVNILMTKLQLC